MFLIFCMGLFFLKFLAGMGFYVILFIYDYTSQLHLNILFPDYKITLMVFHSWYFQK